MIVQPSEAMSAETVAESSPTDDTLLPVHTRINEFIAQRTNHRNDEWGGSYANRMRFPVEIVRRTRERVGPNFIGTLGYGFYGDLRQSTHTTPDAVTAKRAT